MESEKPILDSKPNEEQLMWEAVSDVVNADPSIPAEKKQEATVFAVKTMKEGIEKSKMTNAKLVEIVEADGAKLSPAAGDRESSSETTKVTLKDSYQPHYRPGFTYRDCFHSHPYEYCQRQLYGDFAYHRGFHRFYSDSLWKWCFLLCG